MKKFALLLLTLAIAHAQTPKEQRTGFRPAAAYFSARGPESIVAADLSGHGRMDLAIAATGKVVVLPNRGDGTFGTAIETEGVARPAALTSGDLNGDRIADLVVAGDDGAILVLLGRGDGTFTRMPLVQTGARAAALAIGDWDGDGAADLAVADRAGNRVLLLPGVGAGRFGEARTFAQVMQPTALAIGDWNGDGVPDLAVAAFGSNEVVLLAGGARDAREIARVRVGSGPIALAVGDFDEDGVRDLAVLHQFEATALVLSAGRTAGSPIALTAAAGTIASGDVDGDGHLDLIFADLSGGTVRVLTGSGKGAFVRGGAYAAGSAARAMTVADLDGDGLADAAVADGLGATEVLLTSRSSRTTPRLSASNALGTYTVAVAQPAGNSSVQLSVTSTSATWTASSNASWLHVTAGSASGTGDALVKFSYDVNAASVARTGTLTVAGLTLTVVQAGVGYVNGGASTTTQISGAGNSAPAGITADAAGNVYYCDTNNNVIKKWTFATQQLSTLVSGLTGPVGLAMDTLGNLYISEPGTNTVKLWTASTQQVSTLISSGLSDPENLALDAAGNLYIADTGHNAIDKWTASTQQLSTVVSSSLWGPEGVSVDVAGNLYIADRRNNAIKVWNVSTQTLSTIATTSNYPSAVSVDGMGNVYFIDSGANVWSPVTQSVTSLFGLGVGYGIYVDSQGGAVYATDNYYNGVYVMWNGWAGPATLNEPSAGANDSFQVLPATAFPIVTSDQSWLTLTGAGNGGVAFTVAANALFVSRTAHINIYGQQLTVTQAAVPPGPPATLAKTAGDNQSALISTTFATALKATVTDASSNLIPGASVTFAVVNGGTGASATFPGSAASATVTADANGIATAPTLTANSTPGAFTVTATSGSATTTFNLTVSSGIYSLGSPAMAAPATASSGRVIVSVTPSTSTWAATSNASWLHVTTASGTGSGLVPFTVDANTAAGSRTGTLTISGQTFTVYQAGTAFQRANENGLLDWGLTTFGVATDRQGNLYYTNGTSVNKFDFAANTITALMGLVSAQGITVDAAGSLYIADNGGAGNRFIRKFDGTSLTSVVSSGLSGPTAVAVDGSGNIYITDASTLKKWNGTTLTTLISTGLNAPKGLALDAAGTLYIADTSNNAIKKCPAATCSTSTISTVSVGTVKGPVGIAVDGLGNVYFTDNTTGNNSIRMWNSVSGTTTVESGFPTLKGLAVDATGNSIYVADSADGYLDFTWTPYVGPSTLSEPYAGATDTIQVLPPSVPVGVSSDQTWVVPSSNGFGPVTLTVAPNSGPARTANISIFDLTIGLSQVAPPPGPVAAMVKVTGDGQGGALNSAYAIALKVQVTDANGIPEPNQSVTFAVQAGGGGASATFTGTTTITTDSNGYATAPTLTANGTAGAFTVTATTTGASATFSLTSVAPTFLLGTPTLAVGAAAGSGTMLVIASPANAAWTASANASWLHATSAAGTGSVAARFSYDANAGATARTGTLTIAGQTLTITQVGTAYLTATPSATRASGLSSASGLAYDTQGNLYISDSGHNLIKKWTRSTNVVSTLISGLNNPQGLAFDASGNLYFSENGTATVKKWTASSNTVSTVISTGLNDPCGLAMDAQGNLYIGQFFGNNVLKWTASTQTLTTLMSDQGGPQKIALDPAGNLYILDTYNPALKVWSPLTGQVTTLVTTGFANPYGLAADALGNVYIGDYNGFTVWQWNSATGQVTAKISSGNPGEVAVDSQASTFYVFDLVNNNATEWDFGYVGPSTLAEPAAGAADSVQWLPSSIFVAPTSDQTWLHGLSASNGTISFTVDTNVVTSARTAHVTVLGQQATVTQAAALPGPPASLSKTAGDAQSAYLTTAFATALQVKLADSNGNGVSGNSVTFAVVAGGSGASATFSGSTTVTTDANGLATAPALTANGTAGAFTVTATSGAFSATFNLTNLAPVVTLGTSSYTVGGSAGSGLVVLSVTPSTYAWTATANNSWLHTTASGTGSGTAAYTYDANAGATPRTGTLTVAGQTFTVTQAGAGYVLATPVTTLGASGLSAPNAVTVDASGNVYIADTTNASIKKFDGTTTTTLSTTASSSPRGVTVDASGNLYFTDSATTSGHNALRKWTVSPPATTTLTTTLSAPRGLALDAAGANLYIADTGSNILKKWPLPSGPVSSVATGLTSPRAAAVDVIGNVYFVEATNSRVRRWNVSTSSVTSVVTGFNAPGGVALDGVGNVYVGDTGNNAIKLWNAATSSTSTLASGLGGPVGVWVDAQGSNLYFADTNNNLIKKITLAWVGPSSLSEPASAGSDSIQVVPASTSYSASSDQSWLTITSQSGGTIAFTTTANTGAASRVAHITVLGQSIAVTQAPGAALLTVTKTHTGNFTQGQVGGTHTVTVSNTAGAAPTSGTVTLTENPPAGLTVTAMSGTGWNCSALPACTRSDVLNAGASYPAITVTVTVAANASSPLVNSVSASGGGSATATANDSINIAAVVTGVSSTSTDGSYAAGTTIPITVTFGRAMTVTGTPRIALNSGATANYASGSGTATLTFNYVVAAGQTASKLDATSTSALTLNGGTIVDAGSVAASLTLPAPGAAGSLGANKNIVIDTTAPTVSGVTATTANGAYNAGSAVSITVTFSEPVTVTGTPQLALNSGGTASYASGSGTAVLTFTYTVAAGETASKLDYSATTSLALNSGTIKDTAGNVATLTLAAPGAAGSLGANKNIVIDTTAPTAGVVTATTADGSYSAGATIAITVAFSEAVTVTGTPQLALNSGGTASYASGSGTSTLTFNYTVGAGQTSADLDYTATTALSLNGGTIADPAGNAATLTLATPGASGSLGANKNIVIDTTAPTVTGVGSSTSNGVYLAGSTVNLTVGFTEPVTVTGTPQLALNSSGTAQYASGSGTSTLTFTYTVAAGQISSHLDYSATTSLSAGTIKDAAGNAAVLTLAAPGAAGSLGANSSLVIGATADLTIAKSHSGSFSQGQTGATYSIVVTNSGQGATNAAVSVTDTLPAGLTATAISGTGWSCDLPSLTCSRSDVLAASASYPAITVTVTVAGNAAASVTNSATVSGGGETNTANNTASDVTAIRQSTATAVQSSLNPSTYGDSLTLTATVSSGSGTPTGTVQFYDGASTLGAPVTLSNGVATLTTTSLGAHTHSITAVYGGSTAHLGSTSSALSQVVNGLATSTSVASNLNPATYGMAVTFTATVSSASSTPSGTVTFYADGTSIGTGALSGGVATLTVSSLAIGPRSVTASFPADDVYAGSTSTALTQNITVASSTIALNTSAATASYGASVTFTATVSGTGATPGGSVIFKDGAVVIGTVTLSSGVAAYSTSGLAVGAHSITAVYSGDSHFSGATSSVVTETIQKLTPTLAVTSSVNPSVTGQIVTFTLTASGTMGAPTGTVTFLDGATTLGTATLSGGTASLSVSLTATGSAHSITASYADDSSYNAGTSPAISQTVNAASTTTTVAASSNPALAGSSVTFTAMVAVGSPGQGTATGSVTFYDGGVSIGSAALNAGAASVFTSSLGVGPHSITASFAGSAAFAASSSATLNETISSTGTSTSLTSSVNPSVLGQTIVLTATVTSSGGITPQGTVTFYSGATPLGSPVTVSGGTAALSIASLPGGTSSLTAVYSSTNLTDSTSGAYAQTVLIPVTVQASPSTAQITVDGTNYTGGQTFNWVAGSSHALGAPSPQLLTAGSRLVWSSWSNGASSAAQTVVVPSTASAYTATFGTEYLLTTTASPAVGGSVTGGGWYAPGATATLTATANSGYRFASFTTSSTTSTSNPTAMTVSGAINVSANFTAQAPALAVTIGARTDGTDPGTRNVNVNLVNSGAGIAYNAQITAITSITILGGSGAVTLASGVPGPSPGVQLAPAGSTVVPLVFNWPSTATRISITFRLTATDASGTVTYPFTQTVTSFR